MFTDDALEYALDNIGARHQWGTVHSSYSATGGAVVSAARLAITWNSASSGTMTNSVGATFPMSVGTTARWLGLWSSSAAGVFGGMMPVGASISVAAVAESRDLFHSVGHGFVNDDPVVVTPLDNAGTVPGGITAGAVYYVSTAGSNSFKLSTSTATTSVVDVTNDGVICNVTDLAEQTFGTTGTLQFPANSITISAFGN